MRHHFDRRQLNRNSTHRVAMFRNMATSLFLHERIRTTEAKAKELRRYAERLITLGKRYQAFGPGDEKDLAAKKLHVHRQALSYLRDEKAIERLLGELAQRYETRPGGYTRIVRLGPRRGDAAPMVFIELVKVEEEAAPKEKRRRRRRTKAEGEGEAQTAAKAETGKKSAPTPVEEAEAELVEETTPEAEDPEDAVSDEEPTKE